MILKLATLGVVICLLIPPNTYACGKQKKRYIVSGILMYFPENVQSREAWYGHNFMVEGIPIRPIIIHKEELLKYVGKRVKITGTWNEGTEWHPDNIQKSLPMPIDENSNQPIIRNDGIDAVKLEVLNK